MSGNLKEFPSYNSEDKIHLHGIEDSGSKTSPADRSVGIEQF